MEIVNFQKESAEQGGLRLVADAKETETLADIEKQFVSFMFLRVNSEWRKLDFEIKQKYKAEFQTVFEGCKRDLLLFSYSMVGFDSKADLMFWQIGNSLDLIQDMTTNMYKTSLGSFLETVDSYLSVTKGMMFVGTGSTSRLQVAAGETKYLFLYPCVKHREWYDKTADERDALVEENFMVGKKFQNIKIHLTHAFGFSEHDYLISFETDEPRDFLAMADELGRTAASKHTLRGMPVYTCRQRPLSECLDALG